MGSASGGPGKTMPPPEESTVGGSNAFGPPICRKNSFMYNINVQCCSLKNLWNVCIVV